jgi:hypothetical protein
MDMQKTTAELPVLEDASGRRARWMRRAGRVVYVVFLVWLVAIVLGGLGLTPVPRIPFTHAVRISKGPPRIAQLPRPTPASTSDLRPALLAPAAAVASGSAHLAGPTHARGHRPTAPGQNKVAPGRSSTAPGHTKKKPARGRSATAPGHTKTTPPPAHRRVPPGQTRTPPPPRGRGKQ